MPMPPDIDRYREHVEHFDLTETQKSELIHIVHRMMESFVGRAFGDDPAQICVDAVGSKDAACAGDMIDFKKPEYQNLSHNFNDKKGGV